MKPRKPEGFINLFSLSTKKNPDVAELIRGKSGPVFGHLMSVLTIMKGMPLVYNKDMPEDKECLFDTLNALISCLTIITPFYKALVLIPS